MSDRCSVGGFLSRGGALQVLAGWAPAAAPALTPGGGARARRTACLLSLLLWLSGCGDQLVEYPFYDLPPPTIVSTWPLADATSVAAESMISAVFSQAMSTASIDTVSFTVTQGSTPVAGVVSLDVAGHRATFDPVAALAAGRLYTATITTAAENSDGTALVADYSWSFMLSDFQVVELSVTALRVAAPDYALDVTGLRLLTDAHGVVQSVTGSVELRARSVSGQSWVLLNAAGLDTYAELDVAFTSAGAMPIALSIPAQALALTSTDLTVPQTRTLIVVNTVDGVRSYQAFEVSFHSTR